jgi:hypothetical protein
MAAAMRSPERFPLIRTQSADQMCDALARVYAKPSLNDSLPAFLAQARSKRKAPPE